MKPAAADSSWFALLPIFTTVLLGANIGCSSGDAPELASVTGVVTLDGKPLPDASVVFQSNDGFLSVGTTDVQGHYELRYSLDHYGTPRGTYRVRISTGKFSDSGEIPEKVPSRYNYKSELSQVVESGNNEIDFALTSMGEILQPQEADRQFN